MEIRLFKMARHWIAQVHDETGQHRFTSQSHPEDDNESMDAHARARALAEAEAYIERATSQHGGTE